MSPQTAIAILVETVETAKPYVDSIELGGDSDAREVLEALRVTLNDLRERDNTDEGDWEVAPTADVELDDGDEWDEEDVP